MADGGFLVKFDGKEVERCYAFSVDYDDWQYMVNSNEKHEFPKGLKKIEIIIEEG